MQNYFKIKMWYVTIKINTGIVTFIILSCNTFNYFSYYDHTKLNVNQWLSWSIESVW